MCSQNIQITVEKDDFQLYGNFSNVVPDKNPHLNAAITLEQGVVYSDSPLVLDSASKSLVWKSALQGVIDEWELNTGIRQRQSLSSYVAECLLSSFLIEHLSKLNTNATNGSTSPHKATSKLNQTIALPATGSTVQLIEYPMERYLPAPFKLPNILACSFVVKQVENNKTEYKAVLSSLVPTGNYLIAVMSDFTKGRRTIRQVLMNPSKSGRKEFTRANHERTLIRMFGDYNERIMITRSFETVLKRNMPVRFMLVSSITRPDQEEEDNMKGILRSPRNIYEKEFAGEFVDIDYGLPGYSREAAILRSGLNNAHYWTTKYVDTQLFGLSVRLNESVQANPITRRFSLRTLLGF